MYRFAQDLPPDVERIRARLRKMDDDALKVYGKAAAYLCTLEANHGRPPRQSFVVQLREARAEWRRRFPVRLPESD